VEINKLFRARRMLASVLTCLLVLTLYPTIMSVYAAGAMLTLQVDSGLYAPGETFTADIVMSDNPGFAGMALKISYPRGIEATHIRPIGSNPQDMGEMMDLISGLTLPDGWVSGSGALPAPIPDKFYLVWGRSFNYTASATLFEVTFQVTQDAIVGANVIDIAFEGAQGPRAPVNLAEQPLTIGLTPGTVTIHRPSSFKIYDSNFQPAPNNITLSVGSTAQFYATLDGALTISGIKWVIADSRLATVNTYGLVSVNKNKYTGQLVLMLYSSENKLLDSITLRIV